MNSRFWLSVKSGNKDEFPGIEVISWMKFGEIPGIQVEIKKMTWLQEKTG